MKYTLANPAIASHFAEQLFKFRGVQDLTGFAYPTEKYLNDPLNLDNVPAGADLLLDNLKNHKAIWFLVDCDVDGYTSASILWNYIKETFEGSDLHFLIHEAKQHGLADSIQWIIAHSNDIDLLIVPDAGSNDDEFFEELMKVNIPCLVLDHHEIEGEISNKAIIINNQSSKNYRNKDLTGAGVVYQFCRYLDTVLGINKADNYIDLAALGIISDMGSMISLENRFLITQGFQLKTKNKFFQEFIERQDYSLGGKLTPMGIAFYITPLINALIRVGELEEKQNLFIAFTEPDLILDSTKRGEKGSTETLATQMVRVCINARVRQNKVKEAAVDRLEKKIIANHLLDNKVLLVRLDDEDDFPPTLNGLVAMQLAAKYKKPTMVGRLSDKGVIRGSARGLNESELKDFKAYLQSTDEFNYTAGHANAFGIGIDNERLSSFHAKANQDLSKFNFNEDCYEVNFIFSAIEDAGAIRSCIYELDMYKDSYGQMNPEPLYAVTDLIVYPSKDMTIMGKNQDTLKIVKNGISYLKFKAGALIEELSQYEIAKIELIGKGNVNEWGGTQSPQIFIEECDVVDYSNGF